jgi:hypothetical protein
LDGYFLLDLRGEINLYVSYRVMQCTMSASCVVVRMSREGLGTLHVATLKHAGNLESLLRPSWPNAEEIGNEMYHLVDILMLSGVDQKWFSGYAVDEGEEVMLTTPGIRAVSFNFCMISCNNVLNKNNFSSSHYRQQGTLSSVVFVLVMKNSSQTIWAGRR